MLRSLNHLIYGQKDGLVCMPCFNKLNRLSDLEDDINKKLEVMRTEGQRLATELKKMPGVVCKR